MVQQGGMQLSESVSFVLNSQKEEPLEVRVAREGMHKHTFFIGWVVALSFTFLVSRFPHDAWLFLFFGYITLVPVWYRHVVLHRTGKWLLFDTVWAASLYISIYIVLVLNHVLSEEWSAWGFISVFMVSVSLSCTGLGFNYSFVFYSVEHLVRTFAQVMPLLAVLAMRDWRGGFSSRVKIAWRDEFPASVWETSSSIDLLWAGLLPCLLWFVPYAIWLLSMTNSLAEDGNATPVHDYYAPRVVVRWRKIWLFTFGQLGVTCVSFCWALLLWRFFFVHLAWMLLVFLFTLWKGSEHYCSTAIRTFGPLMKLHKTQQEHQRLLAEMQRGKEESINRGLERPAPLWSPLSVAGDSVANSIGQPRSF